MVIILNRNQTFSTTLGVFFVIWFWRPVLAVFGLFLIWSFASDFYDQAFGISCEKAAKVLGDKVGGLSGGYLGEITQADLDKCRGDIRKREYAQVYLNGIKAQQDAKYLQASGQWCAKGYKQMFAGSDRCVLDCPEGTIEEPGISNYCLKCGPGLRNCKRVLPNGKSDKGDHHAASSN